MLNKTEDLKTAYFKSEDPKYAFLTIQHNSCTTVEAGQYLGLEPFGEGFRAEHTSLYMIKLNDWKTLGRNLVFSCII